MIEKLHNRLSNGRDQCTLQQHKKLMEFNCFPFAKTQLYDFSHFNGRRISIFVILMVYMLVERKYWSIALFWFDLLVTSENGLVQIMLAILIGLLTVLTWHFTRVYTTKSLDTLAYGLRYELLQRPLLRMWNIVNSTAEITAAQVKLSEYVIKRYNKPATQAEQIQVKN